MLHCDSQFPSILLFSLVLVIKLLCIAAITISQIDNTNPTNAGTNAVAINVEKFILSPNHQEFFHKTNCKVNNGEKIV